MHARSTRAHIHLRTSSTHSLPCPSPRSALSGHPAQTPGRQIHWHPRKEEKEGRGRVREEKEEEEECSWEP